MKKLTFGDNITLFLMAILGLSTTGTSAWARMSCGKGANPVCYSTETKERFLRMFCENKNSECYYCKYAQCGTEAIKTQTGPIALVDENSKTSKYTFGADLKVRYAADKKVVSIELDPVTARLLAKCPDKNCAQARQPIAQKPKPASPKKQPKSESPKEQPKPEPPEKSPPPARMPQTGTPPIDTAPEAPATADRETRRDPFQPPPEIVTARKNVEDAADHGAERTMDGSSKGMEDAADAVAPPPPGTGIDTAKAGDSSDGFKQKQNLTAQKPVPPISNEKPTKGAATMSFVRENWGEMKFGGLVGGMYLGLYGALVGAPLLPYVVGGVAAGAALAVGWKYLNKWLSPPDDK